jgi:ribosomal protein S18 acetylase RimI-like enzyme
MEIVRIQEDDLPEVMNFISEVVADMNANGNTQWDETYPTRDIIVKDIEEGTLFLTRLEGEITGICALTEGEEAQYANITWKDGKGRALEIHRIAVHPKWQGKGNAKTLFDFAEEHARKKGYSSMRIDTYCENLRMIKILESRGYKVTGEIFFPPLILPFNCYEKIFEE